MAKTSLLVDNISLYEAALEGLELQKQRIDDQIRQVRAALGNRRVSSKAEAAPVETAEPKAAPAARKSRKRNLSDEARERIAAAQKKRWDAFRAQKDSN